MALDVIIDALSTRWTKSLLGLTLSALGAMGVFAYTQVTDWVDSMKAATEAHAKKDYEQDLRLERLTLAVENTSKSVDKMAGALEKQSDKRDDRMRRMDRLLDLLEKNSHTRIKENE